MARETEVELLGEAIANTEKEIFGEAIDARAPKESSGDEEVADRSLEEMGSGLEGQQEDADDEADDGAEESEADGDDDKEESRDPKTGKFKSKSEEKPEVADKTAKETDDADAEEQPKGHRVPVGELKSERQARQAAEAKAKVAEDALTAERAENTRRFAELNAKLEGVALATRQPPKPEAQAVIPPKPDMFADPEGYEKWVEARNADAIASLSQSFEARLVESSMAAAHDVHKEAFEKAFQAVSSLDKSDPSARATVQRIWKSPNPGAALMRWHREQETLREVGTDPNAYRERVKTETREALMKDPDFRAQLLADLKAEASGANGGQARHTTRLPKSLNGAGGGQSAQRLNPSDFDNSDKAVFEDAFTDT